MAKHCKCRQSWNHEQENIVRTHYADAKPEEMELLLHGAFNRRQIAHKAKKMGVKKSHAYCEKYGRAQDGRITGMVAPMNKGKKFYAGGRSIQTQFKPGSVPINRRPVGSTRITRDGYIEIKTEEGMGKFSLLHREIWKQRHGSYPPAGTALLFKDGNKQNCTISNLEMVTRAELMNKNSVHRFPEELKQVIALKVVLRRKIDGSYHGKRKRDRTAENTV